MKFPAFYLLLCFFVVLFWFLMEESRVSTFGWARGSEASGTEKGKKGNLFVA